MKLLVVFKSITFFIGIILACLTTTDTLERKPEAIQTNALNFRISPEDYLSGNMKYCLVFYDRHLNQVFPENTKHRTKKITKIPFKTLDKYKYWENRKDEEDEPYHVIVSKVAYLLDKPASYFSKERLTNLTYLKETMPDYTIDKLDTNKFKIGGSMFAPSLKFEIDIYEDPSKDSTALAPYFDLIKTYSKTQLHPHILAIQHNYDYGTILWQKTNKMSVALSAYYPYKDKTLVVIHTLNYAHNLPPKLLGREKTMKNVIIETMKDLIYNTRIAINKAM